MSISITFNPRHRQKLTDDNDADAESVEGDVLITKPLPKPPTAERRSHRSSPRHLARRSVPAATGARSKTTALAIPKKYHVRMENLNKDGTYTRPPPIPPHRNRFNLNEIANQQKQLQQHHSSSSSSSSFASSASPLSTNPPPIPPHKSTPRLQSKVVRGGGNKARRQQLHLPLIGECGATRIANHKDEKAVADDWQPGIDYNHLMKYLENMKESYA